MKFYIASLLAFTDIQDTTDDTPLSLTYSIPALIPAESIHDAGDQAKVHALERWKPAEGWHTHQANIVAVTKPTYDSIVQMLNAGSLDTSDEAPLTFNFTDQKGNVLG